MELEENKEQYFDVIIVGLGWVGLSAAYYWAKRGLKVLGLEMNSSSGQVGTSSQGDTRVYRLGDKDPIKNEMMQTSLELWREAEKELLAFNLLDNINEAELLTPLDYLTFGSSDNEYIKGVKKTNPDKIWIKSEEIMKKYTAIENLPNDYIGTISKEAGAVRVKRALNGFALLANHYGAKLSYDMNVTKVFKNSITTDNDIVYKAKNVVVCCGAYTIDEFDKMVHGVKVIPTETLTIDCDLSKMPGIIFEPTDGFDIYGVREGPKLEEYKIGIHGENDFKKCISWIRKRIPSLIRGIKYSRPCFYTTTEDGRFIYKTNPDGIHFCYGLNGEGFKFMPLHGKVIYDGLITKKDTKYVKPTMAKL